MLVFAQQFRFEHIDRRRQIRFTVAEFTQSRLSRCRVALFHEHFGHAQRRVVPQVSLAYLAVPRQGLRETVTALFDDAQVIGGFAAAFAQIQQPFEVRLSFVGLVVVR